MFRLIWRIENFCMLPQKTGEAIQSPVFQIESLNDVIAYIRLYPKGYLSPDHIMYYVHVEQKHGSNVFGKETEIELLFTKSRFMDCKRYLDVKQFNNICLNTSRSSVEFGKFHDLFSYTDNVDIEIIIRNPNNECIVHYPNSECTLKDTIDECVIQNPNEEVIPHETYFGKTAVLMEIYALEVPLAKEKFASSSSSEDTHEYFKTFCGNFRLTLTIQKGFKDNEVEIKRISVLPTPVNVGCKISLINGRELSAVLFCDGDWFEQGCETNFWKVSFDINENKIHSFTKLRCEIIVSDGNTVSEVIDNFCTGKIHNAESTHQENIRGIESEKSGYALLQNIYQKNLLSDVTLQVGADQLPAHKCVLASVSDVFAAMFTSKMEEQDTNVVNVTDIDKDIVQKMLQYIYTGKIENLNLENLLKLHSAADKYQILELKKLCSLELTGILDVTNCLEIIGHADMYQDSDLKISVRNFIHANRKEILNSDEWKIFMKNSVELAADIMFHICLNTKTCEACG